MNGGRRPRRHVTPEEAKLWRAVTRDFVPLEPAHEEPPPEVDVVDVRPSKLPLPSGKAPALIPKPLRKSGAPLADFEPRRAKRLSAGRLPIDARLDLHGLRQDEARRELLSFLQRAQDAGLKHVKVITGKGVVESESTDVRPFNMFEDDRRGVLREQVPHWLGGGAFRALVVSYTVAGRGHGGGGALYVQIRKKAIR